MEGVDVAIRLVKVAVEIIVIAVPDVELAQVGVDLGRGLAGRDLGVVPAVDCILQELPDMCGITGAWIAVIIITRSGFPISTATII